MAVVSGIKFKKRAVVNRLYMCVSVCVCARESACARACVSICRALVYFVRVCLFFVHLCIFF